MLRAIRRIGRLQAVRPVKLTYWVDYTRGSLRWAELKIHLSERRRSVSRARLKERYRRGQERQSAILSKGGPTTTSRLASLPHIMAVALRANVQFRSIVTSVDRGGPALFAEPEKRSGRKTRCQSPVYGKIFAIRLKKKKRKKNRLVFIHKKYIIVKLHLSCKCNIRVSHINLLLLNFIYNMQNLHNIMRDLHEWLRCADNAIIKLILQMQRDCSDNVSCIIRAKRNFYSFYQPYAVNVFLR